MFASSWCTQLFPHTQFVMYEESYSFRKRKGLTIASQLSWSPCQAIRRGPHTLTYESSEVWNVCVVRAQTMTVYIFVRWYLKSHGNMDKIRCSWVYCCHLVTEWFHSDCKRKRLVMLIVDGNDCRIDSQRMRCGVKSHQGRSAPHLFSCDFMTLSSHDSGTLRRA